MAYRVLSSIESSETGYEATTSISNYDVGHHSKQEQPKADRDCKRRAFFEVNHVTGIRTLKMLQGQKTGSRKTLRLKRKRRDIVNGEQCTSTNDTQPPKKLSHAEVSIVLLRIGV